MEVKEEETEMRQKIGEVGFLPADGSDGPQKEKILFPVRIHTVCGGEVIDQDSVDGVKKVLHPESQ
jgi:hypothetical protein